MSPGDIKPLVLRTDPPHNLRLQLTYLTHVDTHLVDLKVGFIAFLYPDEDMDKITRNQTMGPRRSTVRRSHGRCLAFGGAHFSHLTVTQTETTKSVEIRHSHRDSDEMSTKEHGNRYISLLRTIDDGREYHDNLMIAPKPSSSQKNWINWLRRR